MGKSKAVTLLGLILAVNDKVKVVNLSLKKALKQTFFIRNKTKYFLQETLNSHALIYNNTIQEGKKHYMLWFTLNLWFNFQT